MSYLICDRCGGYYELQPGESPEDFTDKCECGGNLRYVPNLNDAPKSQKICPNCGCVIYNNSEICPVCGFKFKICSNCGNVIKYDSEYCPVCKFRFKRHLKSFILRSVIYSYFIIVITGISWMDYSYLYNIPLSNDILYIVFSVVAFDILLVMQYKKPHLDKFIYAILYFSFMILLGSSAISSFSVHAHAHYYHNTANFYPYYSYIVLSVIAFDISAVIIIFIIERFRMNTNQKINSGK